MIRLVAVLLLILTSCYEAVAAAGQSRDSNYNISVSVGSSYQGLLDIVSSATVCVSLRACSNALANAGATTTAVMDVAGSSTGSCTIFLLGNGTGSLDLSTTGAGGISNQCLLGATTFCTVTNTSCTVSKLYDQTGNGHHLTQGTSADQPTLLLSGCSIPASSSLPCLTFGSGSITLASASYSPNTANQVSLSAVSLIPTGSTGNGAIVFGLPANNINATSTVTRQLKTGGGGCVSPSAAQNSWHTTQGAQPTGTSTATLNVDGTETTGTCAANHTAAAIEIVGVNSTTLYWAEGAMYDNVAYTLTQRTNLCANEATYYGTTVGSAC
jgi:hypothetical protein